MIKVGVFYPQSNKFDWDYYMSKHTPMVGKLLKPALKKVEIEKRHRGRRAGNERDLPVHLQSSFRFSRSISSRVRPSRRRDHGRHRELHRRAAGGADQRREDVAATSGRI
jgi:hypothetical protein